MNTKMGILIISFVAIAFLIYPVNAETGTLSVSLSAGNSYTQAASGASGNINRDWSKLRFDVTDYNSITQITFSGGQLTCSCNAASSQFTITSGGTGTGTWSYSKADAKVFYYFFNTVITSSSVTLSFDDLSQVTQVTVREYTGADGDSSLVPSLTKPVIIDTHVLSDGVSGSYITQTQTVVNNNYTATYPGSGIVNVSIDKSGATVSTKIDIRNQTASKLLEPTFNTNSFSYSYLYDAGLILNMSTASGGYDLVTVNTTGITSPTPTPTAQPPFTSTDSINTTKGIYNNTESVDIFGSFYPATTTQTDCLFFGFICTDTTINIESNTGYVFISTQGSTSPIQFLSFTPDKNHNYDILTSLDIGTYQAQLFGFAEPGSTCPSGIVYDVENIPLGCYYPHNITTFQVVNNTPGLFIHWNTRLPNTSVYYGDTVTVAWNNVTANDIVKIYDNTGTAVQTYPINISTVSQIPVFIPLYTVGTWNATIFNGSNLSQSASAFLNVLPPGAISVNNSFGINMYWSKAVDFIDNPTTLNWNTGSYSGLYFVTVTLNGQEVRNNSYTSVPGQTQKAVYSFDTEGTYVAQFLDINGTVQSQADIQISHVVAQPTSTEPVPSGNEASQSLGNNLTTFMGMPAFWGLILWIIVVYAISSSSASGSTALVAFIMANMEAVIGLWSPFTWYILAITWIFAGIYFYFGQEMSQPR